MANGDHVFISYGRADGVDFAKRLAKDLDQDGHKVWIDLKGIEPGGPFDVRIEQAIRSASVVFAVMTESSLREKSVCRDEIVFALDEGKRVVPIRVDPTLKPPLLLTRRNWIDFTSSYDDGFGLLLKFLAGDDSVLSEPVLPEIGGLVPFDFGPEIALYLKDFTGREWISDEVDRWLENSSSRAFVIRGDPGIGKSAIAAWLSQERADQVVAAHFCTDRNSRTLEPNEFVSSLVGQLSSQVDGYKELVEQRNPAQSRSQASDAFRELVVEPLRLLPGSPDPSLIIIDALDEAMAQEGETIVDILSKQAEYLPPWLRIVATTRREAGVLEKIEQHQVLDLGAERQENLDDLSEYVLKRLSEPALAERIGEGSRKVASRLEEMAEGNFLYAVMALEAIAEGDIKVEDLGKMMPGLSQYYRMIFQKTFGDIEAYLRDYAPLLKALSVAFGPLSFKLLQDLLNITPEMLNRRLRVPQAFLHVSRIEEESYYSIFHRPLQEWLTNRDEAGDYWVEPESGHEILAGFLANNPEDEYAIRYLPKHLIALSKWLELYDLLSDLKFFNAIWELNKYDAMSYWAGLEANSEYRIEDGYKKVIESPSDYTKYVMNVASLFHGVGHLSESFDLYRCASDVLTVTNSTYTCPGSLNNQANILRAWGRLDEAMELYKEVESFCRKIGLQAGLPIALGNQADIFQIWGKLDEAMELYVEQERICRELGLEEDLLHSLNNQALIKQSWGKLDEAMGLLKEVERTSYERGYRDILAASLDNQANILQSLGKLDEAMELYLEEERICRELGLKEALHRSLNNQAVVLCHWGKLDEAMELYKEMERICREVGLQSSLQLSLGSQASILRTWGKLDEAMELYKEKVQICRELDRPAELLRSLAGQAEITALMGNEEETLALSEEIGQIALQLGATSEQIMCMTSQVRESVNRDNKDHE